MTGVSISPGSSRPRRRARLPCFSQLGVDHRLSRPSGALDSAGDPEVIDRPLRGPVGRRDVVVLRILAAAGAYSSWSASMTKPLARQDADPVAVTGMELDATTRPVHPVQVPLRSEQPFLRLALLLRARTGWRGRCSSRRRAGRPGRRSRAASRTQRSGSHHTLAPYSLTTRSKLASRSGTAARVGFEQREVETELLLATAGRVELRGGEIDADRRARPTRRATPRSTRYRSRARRRRDRRRHRGRRARVRVLRRVPT